MIEPRLKQFKSASGQHLLRYENRCWQLHFIHSPEHTMFVRNLDSTEADFIMGAVQAVDLSLLKADNDVLYAKAAEVKASETTDGKVMFDSWRAVRSFIIKMQLHLIAGANN